MTKKYIDKVNLKGLYFEKLPDLSDVTCRGDFNCRDNELTSLEGAPKEVQGGFYCNKKQLTSLEGAPKDVRGGFY
jgi:hypothetical protein